MNTFLNGLKEAANFGYTENGAKTRITTGSAVYDLFALGGAYRNRPDEDVILLFKKAYEENADLAMKCLFYLRDILEGQGERRFFRLCMKWLADKYPESVEKNLQYFADFGRWDDLYCLDGTKVEESAYGLIAKQLFEDSTQEYPSLCAKWAASQNTSSPKTVALGKKTAKRMGLSAKEYRKLLSSLRGRLNVLERLMSANEWDKIDFAKIPSKAGIQYRTAFLRHDVDRPASQQSYKEFMLSDETKVNAKALYPYDVVGKIRKRIGYNLVFNGGEIERATLNKYWENLTDYFADKTFNGLCMIDTSGSMTWGQGNIMPIDVALSIGAYCAERAKGPFQNHFMTFQSFPQLVEFNGMDFCDKMARAMRAPWGGSTDIEAAFDVLLDAAIFHNCPQKDIPENLIIVSDMQFNAGVRCAFGTATLMESIKKKWEDAGYKMPKLIFWNVNAFSANNIPMRSENGITFVSGASPVIFDMLLSGKTAEDLMLNKLNSERYSKIVA